MKETKKKEKEVKCMNFESVLNSKLLVILFYLSKVISIIN